MILYYKHTYRSLTEGEEVRDHSVVRLRDLEKDGEGVAFDAEDGREGLVGGEAREAGGTDESDVQVRGMAV